MIKYSLVPFGSRKGIYSLAISDDLSLVSVLKEMRAGGLSGEEWVFIERDAIFSLDMTMFDDLRATGLKIQAITSGKYRMPDFVTLKTLIVDDCHRLEETHVDEIVLDYSSYVSSVSLYSQMANEIYLLLTNKLNHDDTNDFYELIHRVRPTAIQVSEDLGLTRCQI